MLPLLLRQFLFRINVCSFWSIYYKCVFVCRCMCWSSCWRRIIIQLYSRLFLVVALTSTVYWHLWGWEGHSSPKPWRRIGRNQSNVKYEYQSLNNSALYNNNWIFLSSKWSVWIRSPVHQGRNISKYSLFSIFMYSSFA